MVFYLSDRGNPSGIYRTPANGVGSEELLFERADITNGWLTVSPDGSVLLYGAAGNLWVLPDPLSAPGTSTPRPLFQTPVSGNFLQFSPDGRWIAYQSNSTGRDEVYVMPYPGPGPSRQISLSGGTKPRWRGDGKEIFFVAPGGRIAAAEVSVRDGAARIGRAADAVQPADIKQYRPDLRRLRGRPAYPGDHAQGHDRGADDRAELAGAGEEVGTPPRQRRRGLEGAAWPDFGGRLRPPTPA